jgi:hypothetical protein
MRNAHELWPASLLPGTYATCALTDSRAKLFVEATFEKAKDCVAKQ